MQTKLAIIGGSGFYQFLQGRSVFCKTRYGKPSDKILIAEVFNQKIAFLPRHGSRHQFPPHKIPFRANLSALKKLGVQRIIAPCAVGSLQSKIKPGDFVICDQFIDRTKKRLDTFFNGPRAVHISTAEPYCPQLRKIAKKVCQKLKIPYHSKGTVVVIEGPRFSTKAESNFFAKFADIINMTQYPEVVLARELGICYLNISLVTDYDAGLKDRGDIQPVTAKEVIKQFQDNIETLKRLILEIIKNIPQERRCACADALDQAVL